MPDSRIPRDPVPAASADSAEVERLARAAAEAAVGSAWAFFTRTAAQGLDWDDIHGCAGPTDYRARLAAEPGLLLETCQALLDYNSGLTDTERADCRRVVAIADALALRHPVAAEPVQPAAMASPEPAVSAMPEAAAAAAGAEPARRGRLGPWIGAALVLLGTGAALAWLWGQQPPSAGPARPRAAATGQPVPAGSLPAPPAAGADDSPARPQARPGPTAPAAAAPKAAARPAAAAPSAGASVGARPGATTGSSSAPVAAPAPPTVPAAAAAPTPVPAQTRSAAPQPTASTG